MGSGTTGAVAKLLGRNYIGIERETNYIKIANDRIAKVNPMIDDYSLNTFDIKPPRVSVEELVKTNYLKSGELLFDKSGNISAVLNKDGKLTYNDEIGSIHRISALILNLTNNNGWEYWYVKRELNSNNLFDNLISIDELRNEYRKNEIK